VIKIMFQAHLTEEYNFAMINFTLIQICNEGINYLKAFLEIVQNTIQLVKDNFIIKYDCNQLFKKIFDVELDISHKHKKIKTEIE